MLKRIRYLLPLTILLFLAEQAGSQYNPLTENKKYTIPFRLTKFNNIVIKVVLNEKDTADLMFHTAAGDITLTEEAAARLKTIHFDGTVDSVQSWGGNANQSGYSRNNSVSINQFQKDAVTIWKDLNSGYETDGKFGPSLFGDKVVEIDFDKKLLIVESSLPRKARKYEKLSIVPGDDAIFIKAVCKTKDRSFENTFMLHSGYSGAVLLDDSFAARTSIGKLIPITGEKKLSDAYGNIITTKKGLLPFFELGTQTISSVPVGFFEGALGRQTISVIGGDIIRRFNWVIDRKKGYVYIKKNKLLTSPFSNL